MEKKLSTSEEEQARAIYEQLLEKYANSPGEVKAIKVAWEREPTLRSMEIVRDFLA